MKDIKAFPKKKMKKKNDNTGMKNIKLSMKMKNKSWLRKKKNAK